MLRYYCYYYHYCYYHYYGQRNCTQSWSNVLSDHQRHCSYEWLRRCSRLGCARLGVALRDSLKSEAVNRTAGCNICPLSLSTDTCDVCNAMQYCHYCCCCCYCFCYCILLRGTAIKLLLLLLYWSRLKPCWSSEELKGSGSAPGRQNHEMRARNIRFPWLRHCQPQHEGDE